MQSKRQNLSPQSIEAKNQLAHYGKTPSHYGDSPTHYGTSVTHYGDLPTHYDTPNNTLV